MNFTTYSNGGGRDVDVLGLGDEDPIGVWAVTWSCYSESIYLCPVTLVYSKMLSRAVLEI